MTFPIAVLISGSGSNLQAIIDAIAANTLDATISVVVSNKADAYGLERAKKAGIPTAVFSLQEFRKQNPQASREDYDVALAEIVSKYQPKLIVLAGWMLVLSPQFLDRYPQQVINLHPSILPSFPGAHGAKDALEYGVKFTGCTVHFVDTGVDTGPIILQAIVPVNQDDTEDTLLDRIHPIEHRILPEAIQLFAEKKIIVDGRKVRINP